MQDKQAPATPDFRSILSTIPDWKSDRIKALKLEDILVIAACAMICGQGHFTHMEDFGKARRQWLASFLGLPNGIPSHDTFRNAGRAQRDKSRRCRNCSIPSCWRNAS